MATAPRMLFGNTVVAPLPLLRVKFEWPLIIFVWNICLSQTSNEQVFLVSVSVRNSVSSVMVARGWHF